MTAPIPPKPEKMTNALIVLCTAVAVLVLVIDWKIKQDIVRAGKRVQQDIESFERKYYGQVSARETLAAVSDNSERKRSGVVGDSGVAKGTPVDEDPGGHRQKAANRNRANARTRTRSVAVPEANGPVDA